MVRPWPPHPYFLPCYVKNTILLALNIGIGCNSWGAELSNLNIIPRILLEMYLMSPRNEYKLISFTNVWFIACLLDWIAQVFLINCTHWRRERDTHKKRIISQWFTWKRAQCVHWLTSSQLYSSAGKTGREWKDNKADSQGQRKRLCSLYPCLLSLAQGKY